MALLLLRLSVDSLVIALCLKLCSNLVTVHVFVHADSCFNAFLTVGNLTNFSDLEHLTTWFDVGVDILSIYVCHFM